MPNISALCCNPFGLNGHNNQKKNLRNVSQGMIKKMPSLTLGQKICDKCRKKISDIVDRPEEASDLEEFTSQRSETQTSQDSTDQSTNIFVDSLNNSLQLLGQTPIKKKRLNEKYYPKSKIEKVSSAIKRKLNVTSDEEPTDTSEAEMIEQLKEKFTKSTSRSEKMTILTLLPKSWSKNKIQKEFLCSNYMLRKVKELVKEKGILSSPNPKPGKVLDNTIVKMVEDFYCNDDISRPMPGKRDFVTTIVNGEKIQKQKRLVLCNLKEVYSKFKDKYSEVRVGFSKFAELRPKNCLLAGGTGTHSVCVCTTHQNFKLMLDGCRISKLSKEEVTYKHCIARVTCNPPLPSCFLNECKFCPSSENLKEFFKEILDSNNIDQITYKQWVQVDRTSLESIIQQTEEFVDVLIEKLDLLKRHSFIATQQSDFQNKKKNELKDGEFLVICDFSENYTFVVQDEVQGYHWTNTQATVHPFVAYYKEKDTIKHTSYVVLSEHMTHDTVAVHLFQTYLINFLTKHFSKKPSKIFYFSDGSAAQYKNRKNFINLCYHHEDFGINAEWHFSATSHGKGASDGVGGTVKRLAARASLQRPLAEQILNPEQLYLFAKENVKGIHFKFSTTEAHIQHEIKLKERFDSCVPIIGTQKLHSFIPLTKNKIKTQVYSNLDEGEVQLVTDLDTDPISFQEIKCGGFIACEYDEHWWMACVLNKNEEADLIQISFLHPHGPAASFAFPAHLDILEIGITEVKATLNPKTATGRMYTLSPNEMVLCSRLIKKK